MLALHGTNVTLKSGTRIEIYISSVVMKYNDSVNDIVYWTDLSLHGRNITLNNISQGNIKYRTVPLEQINQNIGFEQINQNISYILNKVIAIIKEGPNKQNIVQFHYVVVIDKTKKENKEGT